MKHRFFYQINVKFDLPGGFVHKRYQRSCYLKVLKLLETFDAPVHSLTLQFKHK